MVVVVGLGRLLLVEGCLLYVQSIASWIASGLDVKQVSRIRSTRNKHVQERSQETSSFSRQYLC